MSADSTEMLIVSQPVDVHSVTPLEVIRKHMNPVHILTLLPHAVKFLPSGFPHQELERFSYFSQTSLRVHITQYSCLLSGQPARYCDRLTG
jgi:hypothetical protein